MTGGTYPHVTGLFPFIARTHAYLEESGYGEVIRSRPIPVEYDYSDMLLLAQNVFGLHCVMQMRTVDDVMYSGYIFLFRFQIRCGPYVPTLPLAGVTPLYSMEVSHYVSICLELRTYLSFWFRICFPPISWTLVADITIFSQLGIVHFDCCYPSPWLLPLDGA